MVKKTKNLFIYLIFLMLNSCLNLPEWCIPPLSPDDLVNDRIKTTKEFTVNLNANGHYPRDYIKVSITDPTTNTVYPVSLPSADITKYGQWLNTGIDAVLNTDINIENVDGTYYSGGSSCIVPQIQLDPQGTPYINYQDLENNGYMDVKNGTLINLCIFPLQLNSGNTQATATLNANIQHGDKLVITAVQMGSNVRLQNQNVIPSITNINDSWFQDALRKAPGNIQNQINVATPDIVDNFRTLAVLRNLTINTGGSDYPLYSNTDPTADVSQWSQPYFSPREFYAQNGGGQAKIKLKLPASAFNDQTNISVLLFVKLFKGEVINGHGSGNGQVEMLIAGCNITDSACDPNISPDMEQGAKAIVAGSTVHANSSGRIWLRIRNQSPENYYNSTGGATVKFKTLQISTPLSDAYMVLVNTFRSVTDKVKFNIYEYLVHKSGLGATLTALCMLYIIILSISYLFGLVQSDTTTLVVTIVKVALIAILISPYSWEFFSTYLFNWILAIPVVLLQGMTDPTLVTTANPFHFMDDTLAILFNPDLMHRLILILMMPGGVLLFAAYIFVIFMIVTTFLRVLLFYIFSIFMTAFLISLAPMFIPFLLFKYENLKKKFEVWLEALIRWCVEPTIVIAGLSIISAIIYTLVTSVFFSLYLCQKCMFPININLGVLGQIPFISELQSAFCISGFLPWGTDNFFASSATITVLFIRMLTISIVLILLGKVYSKFPDQAANITQSLTAIYLSGGMGALKTSSGIGASGAADALSSLMSGGLKLAGKGAKALGKKAVNKLKRTDAAPSKPGSTATGPSSIPTTVTQQLSQQQQAQKPGLGNILQPNGGTGPEALRQLELQSSVKELLSKNGIDTNALDSKDLSARDIQVLIKDMKLEDRKKVLEEIKELTALQAKRDLDIAQNGIIGSKDIMRDISTNLTQPVPNDRAFGEQFDLMKHNITDVQHSVEHLKKSVELDKEMHFMVSSAAISKLESQLFAPNLTNEQIHDIKDKISAINNEVKTYETYAKNNASAYESFSKYQNDIQPLFESYKTAGAKLAESGSDVALKAQYLPEFTNFSSQLSGAYDNLMSKVSSFRDVPQEFDAGMNEYKKEFIDNKAQAQAEIYDFFKNEYKPDAQNMWGNFDNKFTEQLEVVLKNNGVTAEQKAEIESGLAEVAKAGLGYQLVKGYQEMGGTFEDACKHYQFDDALTSKIKGLFE